MAMMTAATITGKSLDIPTAVNILSEENTMSSTTICGMLLANDTDFYLDANSYSSPETLA